jgi:uncharacterized protein
MGDILKAASEGDVGEVQRLVGHDRGLLEARDPIGRAPLSLASEGGHLGVVQWLVDNGAAVNAQDNIGCTALLFSCMYGRCPVVRLLLAKGADLTIADVGGYSPLMAASAAGHSDVVRVLLGQSLAKTTMNRRDDNGGTSLFRACYWGCADAVKSLLESGADPTVPDKHGRTPEWIAERDPERDIDHEKISAEGRRGCVAALKVRSCLLLALPIVCSTVQLAEACLLSWT